MEGRGNLFDMAGGEQLRQPRAEFYKSAARCLDSQEILQDLAEFYKFCRIHTLDTLLPPCKVLLRAQWRACASIRFSVASVKE